MEENCDTHSAALPTDLRAEEMFIARHFNWSAPVSEPSLGEGTQIFECIASLSLPRRLPFLVEAVAQPNAVYMYGQRVVGKRETTPQP